MDFCEGRARYMTYKLPTKMMSLFCNDKTAFFVVFVIFVGRFVDLAHTYKTYKKPIGLCRFVDRGNL
jgi:hypothetical protein